MELGGLDAATAHGEFIVSPGGAKRTSGPSSLPPEASLEWSVGRVRSGLVGGPARAKRRARPLAAPGHLGVLGGGGTVSEERALNPAQQARWVCKKIV